jgi:hypothetical protein
MKPEESLPKEDFVKTFLERGIFIVDIKSNNLSLID